MSKSGEKKLTKYQEDYQRYLAKQMMRRLDAVNQRNAHTNTFDISSVLDVMQIPPSNRLPRFQQQPQAQLQPQFPYQPQSQLQPQWHHKHTTIPFINASMKDNRQWKLIAVDVSDPPTSRRKFMDRRELKKRHQQERQQRLANTINLCQQSDLMESFETWIGWKW